MESLFLSHIWDVLRQDSFPVIGDSTSSLVFALLFAAVVLVVYLFIDHLPKPAKNKITSKNEPVYAKVMIALVVGITLSIFWDFWWHRAVGRDSFFAIPHISLYSFMVVSIIFGFYCWRHSRDIVWKHAFFLLLLLPVSAAFDNYFHTLWGVENLSKPIFLPWSPGHASIILSLALVFVLLLKILVRYRRTQDFNFFGNLSFAGIFALILGLCLPFFPTGPWGQIVGFAGAGVISLAYILVLLSAEKTMKGQIDATLTSIVVFFLIAISYSKETAANVLVLPADQPPMWLLAFSAIVPAILLDLTKDRFPMWVRGLFAGITWSGILFGFATNFFAPQFQYGMTEIFTAITFSAMGGLVAGSIFGLFHLDDDKHIEKLLKKW